MTGGAFSSVFNTSALAVSGSPYTITYAYAGDTNFTATTDASQALTVNMAFPHFSGLAHPTIFYGAPTTTFSGSISLVPNGETVSITLDGVTHTATVTGGTFSSVFNTSALAVSGSPYTITYAYAGNTNFTATTDASQTLTVNMGGEIQGTLWNDANGNGIQQPGETPLVGRMVYVDTNGDGHWDTGEPYAMTDANGNYTISGRCAGDLQRAGGVAIGLGADEPQPGQRRGGCLRWPTTARGRSSSWTRPAGRNWSDLRRPTVHRGVACWPTTARACFT